MAAEYLSSEQLERETGIPASTFRYWASIGDGPPSFKLGRRRVWARSDVDAWVTQQRGRALRPADGSESLQQIAAGAVLDAVQSRNAGEPSDIWVGSLKASGAPIGVVALEAVEILAHLVRLSDRPDEMVATLRELTSR